MELHNIYHNSNNVSMEEECVKSDSESSCSVWEDDSGDDSSLDNFLNRLNSRFSATQTISEKVSSMTQTTPKEDKAFREKIVRVSRAVEREIVTVLAPRNRSVDDPAFFSVSPHKAVSLLSRPSTGHAHEPKRKASPLPRRKSSVSHAARPRQPLYAPKLEPRKVVTHNLPWY